MILFGFILMVLMFIVSIAISSTFIVEGIKERDGWKVLLGLIMSISGTGPSGYLAWIFWPHI
jgi:hypothetical protein